jgi:ABC-type lipoprotein release transport system permease subunit
MKHLCVFLCFRYLGSRKIVFLSVAAVGLSCALLIVVASLFTGFINVFENTAGDHLGDVLIGAPSGFTISDYGSLIEQLEESEIIEAATGVLSGQGLLLVDKGDVRAVRVWGIEAQKRTRMSSFGELLVNQKESSGEISFGLDDVPAEEGGFAGIGVVSKADDVTDEYDFDEVGNCIGRKVMLTTGTVVESADSEGPDSQRFKRKAIKFTITDVVFSGMYEFDQNFVYLPLERLSRELYPGKGPVADMIQIRLEDGVRLCGGYGGILRMKKSHGLTMFKSRLRVRCRHVL